MEKLYITEEFLSKEYHAEAISAFSEHIGKELEAGDVVEYSRELCDGKICPEGKICVLGHCVDDDVPEQPEEPEG